MFTWLQFLIDLAGAVPTAIGIVETTVVNIEKATDLKGKLAAIVTGLQCLLADVQTALANL